MSLEISGFLEGLTLTRREVFKTKFLLVPGSETETHMYKMIAYWSAPRPEDLDSFERYYVETHIPRAAAVPHLLRLTSTRTTDALGSPEPYHYRVAEMAFASRERFAQSAASPQFAEMLKCSAEMRARFAVTTTAEAGDEIVFDVK